MESILRIDDLNIRYTQAGEGPDVLVLHGWGGCIESFGPVIGALCDRYRVTALDFPGHGKSDPPPRPSMAAFISFVIDRRAFVRLPMMYL